MTQKIKTFIQNYKAGLKDHDETAFPKPTRSVFHWFLLFLAPVVLLLIVFLLLCAYLWHSPSALPSLSELEKIDPKLATEVYDKDSLPAHEFFVERRIWVPFDSIPELAKHAVMATEDRDFVKELKTFLAARGYTFWDFHTSKRNYQLDYTLELEERIRDAEATLSVVSPEWKRSKTALQELHFSNDVNTPVFLLRVKDPGPTLALAGLTFIDFTQSRDEGFERLDEEMRSVGL